MKAIKFFFVSVIALTLVACSSAEDERFEDNSSNFESIKSLYGIESVGNVADIGNVPSVTAEEMQGVLESLRQNGNVIRECKSENVEGYFGEDGDRQSVRMIAEYQARTRAGAFLEEFALCVSLNFNVDEDTVYYIGTTYSSSTDLFCWKGYGASLSTTVGGGNVFTAITHLYFRVSDQKDCLVKVPVDFKGNYNFNAGHGTYSFTLSNCHK
ncbi:DUF5033 domain-containing protein [Bacteroides sp. f07]|uniref:DUF5033 domain-containing protein n=1 Tax=Bacteroides sp. f07 TaxID=3132704 RepID=UPI0034AF4DB3